eukprot:scaffold60433_cov21-Tisochrysis_lutea.AAC.2
MYRQEHEKHWISFLICLRTEICDGGMGKNLCSPMYMQEHERLRSLFSSYRRLIASDGQRDIKLAVFKDIVSALSQHASAETRTPPFAAINHPLLPSTSGANAVSSCT